MEKKHWRHIKRHLSTDLVRNVVEVLWGWITFSVVIPLCTTR